MRSTLRLASRAIVPEAQRDAGTCGSSVVPVMKLMGNTLTHVAFIENCGSNGTGWLPEPGPQPKAKKAPKEQDPTKQK